MTDLTNEELAARIKNGEREYIPELWSRIEKLLKYQAYNYYNKSKQLCDSAGVASEDLMQENYFAMINAVNAYDLSSKFKFNTFLSLHIRNEYNKALDLNRKMCNPLNKARSLDEPIDEESTFPLRVKARA